MGIDGAELLLLEDAVWVFTQPIGVSIYDFAFDSFMACRRPFRPPESVEAVARVGAFEDYTEACAQLGDRGISLVNSTDAHLRASRLPEWYGLIEDLTPKSIWSAEPLSANEVRDALGWPIFMKGERQTNRHVRRASIIEGPAEYEAALELYAQDAVLSWQDIVCRQLAPLRPVEDPDPARIPSSYEFRTFWWRGELVGCGRYWWEGKDYGLTESERGPALAVAGEASRRVDVPFLVVDIAQRADGEWIVIECNDAQESGYAGVPPMAVWQAIVSLERERA